MSDDLVKRLRDPSTSSEASTARHQAADRIDELEVSLQAVLNREAATTARYDAKTDELEAKLAKAVEGLLLARVHVANNEQGWSVGRASARSDLEIINATLAEIESSTPYGLKGEKG